MMDEASFQSVRYVYVQTLRHLWRFDYEGRDNAYKASRFNCYFDCSKGLLTQLIDFQKAEVPLGAGGFVFRSKLFFVGGETVKTDTPYLQILPYGGSFDDEHEFSLLYNCDPRIHEDDIGHFKLPRSALNKRIFVFDHFFDSNSKPLVPSISTDVSQSQAPKTNPFVVPIKKGGRTLIYVLANITPLFYQHTIPPPTFEVYDPEFNSWEELPAPFDGAYPTDRLFFEFYGKLYLLTLHEELSFDPDTKIWKSTHVFESCFREILPDCMIYACRGVYLSCTVKTVRAFKLDPEGNLRTQLLRHLFEDDRCHSWPVRHSTLYNLGDGIVLYVSTAYYGHRHHFVFVRFHIGIVEEQKKSHPLLSQIPFVLPSIIDVVQRRVPYQKVSHLDTKSKLNVYVL